MGLKYKLEDFQRIKDSPIFFDANVLIFLFWPTGQKNWEDNYARAFNRLRKQGNTLLVNFLVLSEVVNRIIRIEFGRQNGRFRNFKEYRESPDGQEALEDIHTIVRDTILKTFEVEDDVWGKQDLLSFLTIDTLDFSDKAIAKLCQKRGWVLFTDDADFKQTGLTLFSGNPRLLR